MFLEASLIYPRFFIYHSPVSIYKKILKSLKSINPFCGDVNLSENWLMRGRSSSPELWKGVDAFFLHFFDRLTLV